MRIAVHLNLFRLRGLLTEYYASPASDHDETSSSSRGEAILRILSGVAADEARFSHWLVTLRTFWLLNWLEFDEYCRQLKEIAYTDQTAPTSPQ